MLTDDTRRQLIQSALHVRQMAYAPYSQFQVGAALLGCSGKLFTGVNVENASYGLTVCAERTAVFNALSWGERDFAAIAIATPGGATPCGACRQVLAEFAEELEVLIVDADHVDTVIETSLKELLPQQFRLS